MGFYSWKCCESEVSIPHDYAYDVVLVLPDNSTVQGKYDGYGNLGDHGSIYDIVGTAVGILQEGVGTFDLPRRVADAKTSAKYALFKDFETYAAPIIIDGVTLYDGQDVNSLLEQGVVVRIPSTMERITPYVKLLVHYRYKGQLYDALKTSENCEYQGFFYPEDYDNFPVDY